MADGQVRVASEQGHLAGLRAIRDRLATDIDVAGPAVVAQIAGQLRQVLAEIAALEAATPEVSASDDIARQLREGLAGAEVVQLAGRGRQRRSG